MKKIKEYDDLITSTVLTDTTEKSQKMPNYLRNANEMAAFLEAHPFPVAWMKDMKNSDIKRCFQQNKSIQQIA